jgi:hypothetical protein
MKKLFLALPMLFLCGVAYAGSPVYFPQNTDGLKLYIVGDSTTTTATYIVTDTSITFTTTGGAWGVQEGSTYFLLTGDICGETLDSFCTYVNALSTTTLGAIGGIHAELASNVYGLNLLSGLATAEEATCLGVANEASLAMGSIIGMSYVIPAETDRRINLFNLVANATFGSGSTAIYIYNGTGIGEQIRKEKVPTTALDKELSLSSQGLQGGRGQSMRIDVVGTAAITYSYLNLIYGYDR